MKEKTKETVVKAVNKKSSKNDIESFVDTLLTKEPTEKKQKPKLANIKLEKLKPFEGHPYKIVDDESMEELKTVLPRKDC